MNDVGYFICINCSVISVLTSRPKMERLTLLGAIVHTLRGHKVIRAWKVDPTIWEHWIEEEK